MPMFPSSRQRRLDPVLTAIAAVPGVVRVEQDDFDNVSINVFITLDDDDSRAGTFSGSRPFRFKYSLRSIKNGIKSVCAKCEEGFNWLDWPVKRYSCSQGDRIDDGYSKDSIKIEVFV